MRGAISKPPERLTMLVAEDDEAYQILVREVTELSGFECVITSQGREFIKAFQEHVPDLLLIDYMLGDITAPEVIGTLRELGAETPFIVMTGFGDEDVAVEMMKLGAIDYLVKDDAFLKRLSIGLKTARDKLLMKRELTHTQKALKRQRDYYRSFVEHSRDIIFLLDPAGRIHEINPAFQRETGFSQEAFLGLFIKELVNADHHAQLDLLLEQVNTGRAVEPCEITLRDSAGGQLPVEASLTLLPSEEDNEILLMARTLRERKRLEEQLRQSQKMQAVGRMAGGMAHDFNNILTTIIGFSELISECAPGDSEIAEYIGEIRSSSRRATALTSQLLAFSRRQVLQPRVLHLNSFVLEARRMLDRLLSEDIRLQFELASELMAVKVDHGQLSQLLLNLVVNARDALPGGGVITIRTCNVQGEKVPHGKEDWYVRLTVTDNGIGMTAETVGRIFEPFFTTKEEGQGTGLGLAVVYGIVSQHNGLIEVESIPGTGSTFHIFLPAFHREKRVEAEDEEPSNARLQGAWAATARHRGRPARAPHCREGAGPKQLPRGHRRHPCPGRGHPRRGQRLLRPRLLRRGAAGRLRCGLLHAQPPQAAASARAAHQRLYRRKGPVGDHHRRRDTLFAKALFRGGAVTGGGACLLTTTCTTSNACAPDTNGAACKAFTTTKCWSSCSHTRRCAATPNPWPNGSSSVSAHSRPLLPRRCACWWRWRAWGCAAPSSSSCSRM